MRREMADARASRRGTAHLTTGGCGRNAEVRSENAEVGMQKEECRSQKEPQKELTALLLLTTEGTGDTE
jgi:hypothetical protein